MPFGGSGSDYGGGYGDAGDMAAGEFGAANPGGRSGSGPEGAGRGIVNRNPNVRFFINFAEISRGSPTQKNLVRGERGIGDAFSAKMPFGEDFTEVDAFRRPLTQPKLTVTEPVGETPTQVDVDTIPTIADEQRQASKGALRKFGAATLAALQNPSLQDTGDIVPQGNIGVS